MTHDIGPVDCNACSQQLSALLDNDLPVHVREVVETHLRTCANCTRELDELRTIVHSLSVDTLSASDMRAAGNWENTAKVIRASRSRTPSRFQQRYVLASAAVLAIVSFALDEPGLFRSTRLPGIAASTSNVPETPTGYDDAVRDLANLLDERRTTLAPNTVAAIDRTLATLDRAIADAREVLAQDPTNSFVARQLGDLRQRKLDAMRDIAAPIGHGS